MIALTASAPWTSTAATVLVSTVLLTSVQLKLADMTAFLAWTRVSRRPWLGRLVAQVAIPAELALVLLLAAMSLGPGGAPAAAAVATSAAITALLSTRIMGVERCACFGRASLAGGVSASRLFGMLAAVCLALAALDSASTPVATIPAALAILLWVTAPVASTALAGALTTSANAENKDTNPSIPPALRDALAPHTQVDAPARACVILFTMKGCPPCLEIAGPFEEFARAFPGNARYFVFERGGASQERVEAHVVHLSAANPDLPKSAGITMFPSALLLPQGPERPEVNRYINADGIRALLATLIRLAPAVPAPTSGAASHAAPGQLARTPTPSAHMEPEGIDSW